METTVRCQLRFDPATMRGAAMEISYDGMPLKISSLLSFISEFNAPRLSGPRCIESPYVAGGAPTPSPPLRKPSGRMKLTCNIQTAQSVKQFEKIRCIFISESKKIFFFFFISVM